LSAFKGSAFALAERSGRSTVVFELKPRAIVGCEDEVSVLGELEFAKKVCNTADFGVDVLNYVSVCVEGIRIADFIWHVEWDVRHGVGQIKEERFVLIALDELD
jgi:hypothetical protein